MDREDAKEARLFLDYAKDCDGLMVSEFLSYNLDDTKDVLDDLQTHKEKYKNYHILYFYVVDRDEKLVGVLRMHDLLFPSKNTPLSQIMISSPLRISHKASLRKLETFFDEHHLFGIPAVDDEERTGCVVQRCRRGSQQTENQDLSAGISGVIGGEEFRTMPLWSRSGRRLAWLSMNIVLNMAGASVIAMYQDTLAAVKTLACRKR